MEEIVRDMAADPRDDTVFERILSLPEEQRDFFLYTMIKSWEGDRADAPYELLSVPAIMMLSEEGDPYAKMYHAEHMVKILDTDGQSEMVVPEGDEVLAARRDEALRLAEEAFRETKHPRAGQLINRLIDGYERNKRIAELAEGSMDWYLSHEDADMEAMSAAMGMAATAGQAYQDNDEKLREAPGYKERREQVDELKYQLAVANSSTRELKDILVFFGSLFMLGLLGYAIWKNYLPGGEDYGGTPAMAAFAICCIVMGILFQSFKAGLFTAFGIAVVGGLSVLLPYGDVVNTSLLPTAVLALIFVIILIVLFFRRRGRVSTLRQYRRALKNELPEYEAALRFCEGYCEKRVSVKERVRRQMEAFLARLADVEGSEEIRQRMQQLLDSDGLESFTLYTKAYEAELESVRDAEKRIKDTF